MGYNKGRLIPDARPLSEFRQEDSRSPFDGEVVFDDTDKSLDIGVWVKNMNNVWECHMRTKEIQKIIDSYGSSGDNTFQNATAFYESGIIHKFFFSQKGQRVWLDSSFDISKFAYYAIKSINSGKERYVTGLVDSDGTDYLKALIPVSMKYGKLTSEIFINTWYTVEFYNNKKELMHSINYLSHQALTMPIDLINEPSGKENTITNVKLTFDRVDKDGKGILYKGERLSDIHPHLRLTVSDGHIIVIDNVEKIKLLYNNLNINQVGEYNIKAFYMVFDNDNASERKIFKYFKDIVFYYGYETQKPYIRITMPKIETGMRDREYKEVRVRGIGNEDTQYITDFEIEQDENGNDVVLIPHEYFKIEKNSVLVYYTETTDVNLIHSDSLYIPVENTVKVIEPEVYEYDDFKAIGYIVNVGGENKVAYKSYVIRNGIVEEITELVNYVYPQDYESGKINRIVAKFKGHEEVFFSYFMDPNVSGNTKILTSKSRSDLSTTPETLETPVLLYSTGYSDFTLGMGNFTRSNPVNFDIISNMISPNTDLIRIRNIKANKYMTHYVRNNSFTYMPSHKTYVRISKKAKTLKDVISNVLTPDNYSVSYRIVKCKNEVLTNTYGTRTVKEILQMLNEPSDSFGTFIGYSLSNGWIINDIESERLINNGEKLYYYEWFALEVDNMNTPIPLNFDGLVEFKYTLNRITISNNDCFLIEGYNSSNKNKCLGSIIAHAAVRI